MQKEQALEIGYRDALFNQDWEHQYFKTTFELKEPLNTANGYPSLEIVSRVEYDADSLNDCAFIDMQDLRYGETYCIATSLIKGFRQVPFDAREWNEVIKTGEGEAE